MKNIIKFIVLASLISIIPHAALAQKTVLPCYQVSGAPCQVVNSTHGLPVTITGPISSIVNLGTSTSATSPRITGDATSGFYTAGAGKVDVSISGSKIDEWLFTGESITGNLFVSGPVAIGSTSATAGTALDLGSNTTSSNSSLLLPVGTTAARPTGVNGMIRYNSTTPGFEGFANGSWGAIAGSFIGSALNSGQMVVGNASNIATAFTLFGDTVVSNTGQTTTNSFGNGNVPGSACAANTGTSAGTVPLLNSSNLQFSGTGTSFAAPVSIGTTSATSGVALDLGSNTTSSNSAILLPIGTTAARPTGVNGMLRYNSTTQQGFEGFINGSWEPVSPYYPIDTTVGGSIGIGQQALLQQTSSAGYSNTAIGFQSMNGAITTAAIANTALGNSALKNITAGDRNTAVGNSAGNQITTGRFNTGVGRTSLGGTSGVAGTGNDNTAMGDSALTLMQGAAADNTGLGFKALAAVTTATQNTAVGSNACLILTGGANTIIGYNVASTTLTTGTDNILIGVSSAVTTAAAGTSNTIQIGGTGATGGAGSIGCTGTGTLSSEACYIRGAITFADVTTGTNTDFVCMSSGNTLTLQTSACTISQRKLKENFETLNSDQAINEVMALKPTAFNMREGDKPNADPNYTHRQIGFIAEDVAEVDPRLSVYENDMVTPKSWRQESVIALLTSAVQTQQSEIKQLNNQIVAMGGKEIIPANDNWFQRNLKKMLNL